MVKKQVIKLKDVSKKFQVIEKKSFWKDLLYPDYATVNAVSKVGFGISSGEAVALLGPNGAGKTTVLKMLSGLLHPSSGEISVLGFTPFDRKNAFLSQMGFVMGSKAGLHWDLTPKQSFELLGKIYRVESSVFEKRVTELVELLNIEHILDTQVRKLSLGERMKSEIVGSILHAPKILFLDEPTIGLDIISKRQIRQFLRKQQQDLGITLLVTSHDMDDIEVVCDRVIIINEGKKGFDGDLKELQKKYAGKKSVRITFHKETPNEGVLAQSFPIEHISQEGQVVEWKVTADELPDFVGYVLQSYLVDDIEIQSVSLEDIIADLFDGSCDMSHGS